MSDIAIRVKDLGKSYRIGKRERYHSLRDSLMRGLTAPFRRLRVGGAADGDGRKDFWALKDVSFEVPRGQAVGIIGRNGAGKSTLLKILSRITEPSAGEVELRGRVGSLLEVGTGFHPELTGRENVYLNGAILGMSRGQIRARFDEIVDFSGVEEFLETPVKHYSSGMYMRLAFAVAAHLEPDILVVDEVLAVGDAQFQKKCLGKMGEVARGGRTVLFVSHNLAAVQRLCSRCLLLDKGRVTLDSGPAEAGRTYLASARGLDGVLNRAGRQVEPTGAEILDAWLERDGLVTGSVLCGDRADVVLDVEVKRPGRVAVELLLRQHDGLPVAFIPSGLACNWHIDGGTGKVRVRCQLPQLNLARGGYSIDLMLADSGIAFLDYVESAIGFQVDSAAVGDRHWDFQQGRGQGCFVWDVTFASERVPAIGAADARGEQDGQVAGRGRGV